MNTPTNSEALPLTNCSVFEEWWQDHGFRADPPVLEMAYKEIAFKGWIAASPCSRLLEAQDIIRQLLIAVPTGHCADFHHSKKDQHGWQEPCPVEKRWKATTKRAEDFISSANTQPTPTQQQ